MKTLIYIQKNKLTSCGGPLGYCNNIYERINDLGITDIDFLEEEKKSNKKHFKFSNYISTYLKTFLFPDKSDLKLFEKYDIVHFHSTFMLYKCRKSLKKYKGKVVLTSHSPLPLHMEMSQGIKDHHKWISEKILNQILSRIDKFSFKRTDFIFFPCREAEESYFNNWSYYKKIRDEHKIKYLVTGIKPVLPKVSRQDFRNKYDLDLNVFTVSYVGRHNEIKGYKRLKEIGNSLKDDQINFVIGGKEGPLFSPKLKNWKEIGWTNDPYSLIASSDLFVLPNVETYFDLVLLEVICLGTPCLISNTGGNKFFKKFECPGIMFFDSVDEAVNKIRNFALKYKENQEQNRLALKSLYNQYFSNEIFVDNYIALLNSLEEERK